MECEFETGGWKGGKSSEHVSFLTPQVGPPHVAMACHSCTIVETNNSHIQTSTAELSTIEKEPNLFNMFQHLNQPGTIQLLPPIEMLPVTFILAVVATINAVTNVGASDGAWVWPWLTRQSFSSSLHGSKLTFSSGSFPF